MIVMHTTHGGENTANDLWNYFASGDRFASTQFVVGRDGSMMQMLDMFTDQVEVGHAVGGYNDRSVSIELNNPGNYSSKSEVPPAQYEAALRMVKSLMQTYSISTTGVVSHGSLGGGAGDPGEGFMRDFIADLPNAQPLDGSPIGNGSTQQGGTGKRTDTACVITRVGEPTTEKPPLPSECLGSGGAGLPGQPLPSDDPAEIKQILCDDYKVCPTVTANAESQPDQDWTLNQLTALWNVVQKIYASPTYKAYAIGNTTLEVTRAACYPGGCDDTMGYYANRSYTSWNAMSGTRLVIATNNVPKDGPMAKIEWLLAHEIGHGASGGSSDGNFLDCLDCNEPSSALKACGEAVSSYASGGEYVPEAISYYMTAAEEVNSYNGDDNMKTDFPCLYNAAKDGFFGGVEY